MIDTNRDAGEQPGLFYHIAKDAGIAAGGMAATDVAARLTIGRDISKYRSAQKMGDTATLAKMGMFDKTTMWFEDNIKEPALAGFRNSEGKIEGKLGKLTALGFDFSKGGIAKKALSMGLKGAVVGAALYAMGGARG